MKQLISNYGLGLVLSGLVLSACNESSFRQGSDASQGNSASTSTKNGNNSSNANGGGNSGNSSSGTGTGSGTSTVTGTDTNGSPVTGVGGIDCQSEKPGLNGFVYRLSDAQKAELKLPSNYAAMTPVGQLTMTDLNVPRRAWSSGFPGVADLVEYFSIRFVGKINLPAGRYAFSTISDDGSKVYIDGKMVVSNDGQHEPRQSYTSESQLVYADYTAGKHDFVVEWYQGPRVEIALQVFKHNAGVRELVPPGWLSNVKDCNLQDFGDFKQLGLAK